MYKKEVVVSVTGHRPGKLFGYDIDSSKYNIIRKNIHNILNLILLDSYKANKNIGFRLINGGALGIDMIFAEESIKFKNQYKYINIKCECAIPCLNQELKWPRQSQERYNNILQNTDIKTVIFNGSYPGAWCMQTRNEYMVDQSDFIIAFYDGWSEGGTKNCVDYAEKQNKTVIYIDPKHTGLLDFSSLQLEKILMLIQNWSFL